MSLDKCKDRTSKNAKYEFMQEFSIFPNESDQNRKQATESKKAKDTKNRK